MCVVRDGTSCVGPLVVLSLGGGIFFLVVGYGEGFVSVCDP